MILHGLDDLLECIAYEECTNRRYSGPDVPTKTCPKCREERGYTETMVLHGLDDLLECTNFNVSDACL